MTSIKIELDTLSLAWDILDELGLSSLLIPGNPVEIKPLELARKLLGGRKLQEFVAAITGQGMEEAKAVPLSQAATMITDFFTVMASELAPLAGIVSKVQPQPAESPTTHIPE
jgi:hypothetical protein